MLPTGDGERVSLAMVNWPKSNFLYSFSLVCRSRMNHKLTAQKGQHLKQIPTVKTRRYHGRLDDLDVANSTFGCKVDVELEVAKLRNR